MQKQCKIIRKEVGKNKRANKFFVSLDHSVTASLFFPSGIPFCARLWLEKNEKREREGRERGEMKVLIRKQIHAP